MTWSLVEEVSQEEFDNTFPYFLPGRTWVQRCRTKQEGKRFRGKWKLGAEGAHLSWTECFFCKGSLCKVEELEKEGQKQEVSQCVCNQERGLAREEGGQSA